MLFIIIAVNHQTHGTIALGQGGILMAKKRYSKERILEAAYQITRDEDLSALSMRAIARKIGCSVMPIYDSFESKEDLMYEVNKYSLRKTLYDFSDPCINERYHHIIRYGFRYPNFFLKFVRFEQSFIHDDAIVCQLCSYLHGDPRFAGADDRDLLKINARLEAFITGIIHTYHADKYDEKVVERVIRVVDDTLDALVHHIIGPKQDYKTVN